MKSPRQLSCENLKLGYYYILGITEIINSITSDDDTYSYVDVSFVSTKSSYLMKTFDSLTVALAEGTRASVRNGKLFIITDTELPTSNGTICTAFLDKKQFVSALLKHNGASKFVNDKLIEEMDIKRGDDYVTTKVYNDYAVAYAASHCSYVLQPTLMEAGDTYDKANGELGVVETSYVKFDIISVEPDEAMSAALTKYAAAERDFFGF